MRNLSFVLILILMGCGHAFRGASVQGPSSSSSSAAGGEGESAGVISNLDLRIARAGDDSQVPEGSGESPSAVIGPSEMELSNVIRLPEGADEKPLFLVWDERGALGSPIQTARYAHRIQRSDNRVDGTTASFAVDWDQDHARWYIPLADLMRQDTSSSDALEMHLVDLDLVLQNGTRLEFQIRFRVTAPVSALRVTRLDVPGQTDVGSAAGEMLSGDGWEVVAYRIENPSFRRIRVRMLNPEANVQVRSILNQTVWRVDRPFQAPYGATEYFDTRVQGGLQTVEVCVDHFHCSTQDLHLDLPLVFDLDGSAGAEVHWRVGHRAGEPVCDVPRPRLQHVEWNTLPYHPMQANLQDPSALAGIELSGDFRMSLRFGNPTLLDEQWSGSQAVETDSLHASVGAVPPAAPLESCQGLFRP
jgi:hypothetical protein